MEIDTSSSRIVVQSAQTTNVVGMFSVYVKEFDVYLCNREVQKLDCAF